MRLAEVENEGVAWVTCWGGVGVVGRSVGGHDALEAFWGSGADLLCEWEVVAPKNNNKSIHKSPATLTSILLMHRN